MNRWGSGGGKPEFIWDEQRHARRERADYVLSGDSDSAVRGSEWKYTTERWRVLFSETRKASKFVTSSERF